MSDTNIFEKVKTLARKNWNSTWQLNKRNATDGNKVSFVKLARLINSLGIIKNFDLGVKTGGAS